MSMFEPEDFSNCRGLLKVAGLLKVTDLQPKYAKKKKMVCCIWGKNVMETVITFFNDSTNITIGRGLDGIQIILICSSLRLDPSTYSQPGGIWGQTKNLFH